MKTITLTTDDELNTTSQVVEVIDGIETSRDLTDDDKLEIIYLNGGVPASIQTSLQEQLAAEKQAWLDAKDTLNAAHRRAIETVRAERQAEVDSLQAQLATARIAELEAVPEHTEILATLNAAYKAAITEDLRPTFAPAFAIVRVLIQAGETEQAVAYVESLAVPPNLEQAKADIISLLTPTDP